MATHSPARPTVLLVDPDPSLRRLLRLCLEVDGARVLESWSPEHARRLLADDHARHAVHGAVVAAELSEAVAPLLADVPVVVTGEHTVDGDVEAILSALDLPAEVAEPSQLAAVAILDGDAPAVAEAWRELCRWDPLLGPDHEPPIAEAVVRAVADAMRRPQPLGWGPDPEIEKVAEVFAVSVNAVETAVGELVCLREALRRRLAGALPSGEEAETFDRLHMIVDRAMGVAVARIAQRLEQQAYVDPLTGLLNRRALERDARREVGRAGRHGRRFAVVLADLDGLKAVNDRDGHAAGDIRLRSLASALVRSLRMGDAAYRIGGDEFVVLLPEATDGTTDSALDRVVDAGAPPFTWGAATFPDDGQGIDALLACADERLLARKHAKPRP